jgi:hypothetical protein
MPSYRTPGVYIEEISNGPRPVAPSSTTDTGFVAMITLPRSVVPGRGRAAGMFLPGPEPTTLLSWNRALAFRGLFDAIEVDAAPPAAPAAEGEGKAKKPAAPPAAATGANRFQQIVGEVLPGKWDVSSPSGAPDVVTLKSEAGDILRIPANRTLLSVKTAGDGAKLWDLSWGADEQKVIELISGAALHQDVAHKGDLPSVDPGGKPVTIDVEAIHERIHGTAPGITNMTGFEQWRRELGSKLFKEILLDANKKMSTSQADAIWETLPQSGKDAWDKWLRSHPGIRRLEIALIGFFSNGGASAYLAAGVQAHGAAGPAKRAFLEKAFDGVSAVAMLVAPGLDFSWQQAILEYAGPKGRGDVFAVLEAPRWLMSQNPRGIEVDDFRWTKNQGPYEMGQLEFLSEPQSGDLRFLGFSSDEVLDRCTPRDDTGHGAVYGPWIIVENPISTGAHDKYVVAPPGGHVVGTIAGTDLRAGGGVHKAPANEQVLGLAELVTNVSDREQGPLNMKGINIIRHRPAAGIRIWGARTVGADPLWTYVNVRRLFLFVERSVRDAVNWAVFLPNNDRTRTTLKQTISSFLIRLFNEGMLDGATWQESFTVKCDGENNPDVDVRSGLLTVDVAIRPVYPAEFVRIRFQQSAMKVE